MSTLEKIQPQPLPEEYLAPPTAPPPAAVVPTPAPPVMPPPPGAPVVPPPPMTPPDATAPEGPPLAVGPPDVAPTAPRPAWPWILGGAAVVLALGVLAVVFLMGRGGAGGPVTAEVDGIGTVEFTSVQFADTWTIPNLFSNQPGTVRPSGSGRTLAVVKATVTDPVEESDSIMDWAGEVLVGHQDRGTMAGTAKPLFISLTMGSDAPSLLWVTEVPEAAADAGLQFELPDGQTVNIGSLPTATD
jgi:hypothetical protein